MLLKGVYTEPISQQNGSSISLSKNGKSLSLLPLNKASNQHRSFILSTWVRSASQIGPAALGVAKDTWLKYEPPMMERLFADGECWVCVDPEDPFVIIGWIAGHKGVLHYSYVIPEFRRIGLSSTLIDIVCGKDIEYSWPVQSRPKLVNQWNYNPYLRFLSQK